MEVVRGVVLLMHAQLPSRSPDGLIRSIAARQNGIVRRPQLLDAGLTKMQIETRLADGRLVPLHRGVYLVGAVPSELAYAQAALLACGDKAVLSHRSAAAIWGLLVYPPTAQPWVTVPSHARLVRPRIVIRRGPLESRDTRRRHGMRVVSPPRAVLDCASLLDDLYELEALVADAAYRRLAFGEELRGQVERNAGRPGVAPLRRVLDLEGGPRRTRSKGERWFLQLLREHRITGYEVNEKIHGKEVDFLWRDQSFCVSHGEWSLALPRNGLSQRPFPARQA